MSIFSIWLIFLNFCYVAGDYSRNKRAVWSINAMSKCQLGYPAWKYMGYGCWCGPGNADADPVNEIDGCCMLHDQCYDDAVKAKICFLFPSQYAHKYDFSCNGSNLTCLESENNCSAMLCECDKDLISCWSKLPPPETKAICPKSRTFMSQAKDILGYVAKEFWDLLKEWGSKIISTLGLHLIASAFG